MSPEISFSSCANAFQLRLLERIGGIVTTAKSSAANRNHRRSEEDLLAVMAEKNRSQSHSVNSAIL